MSPPQRCGAGRDRPAGSRPRALLPGRCGPAGRPARGGQIAALGPGSPRPPEQGAFGDCSLIHCDDHLTDMVLRRGGDLLDRLEARRLAPLRDMAHGRQDMLAQTLLAWLETGKSSSVASRLFIHPQTARYRLHKLQHLFGDDLDDPDARFELALVLRARCSSPRQRPCGAP